MGQIGPGHIPLRARLKEKILDFGPDLDPRFFKNIRLEPELDRVSLNKNPNNPQKKKSSHWPEPGRREGVKTGKEIRAAELGMRGHDVARGAGGIG